MGAQFRVIFTGELKPGVDRDEFISTFAKRLKSSEDKVAAMLDSGKAVPMKSGLSREEAEKFQNILETMGMSIAIEPMDSNESVTQPAPSTDTATEQAQDKNSQEAGESNPYQTPTADLQRKQGEMSGPVTVPAGHGMSWIGDAYRNHFKGNIGSWIAATIVLLAVNIVFNLIPVIGNLVYMLIAPVLTAGLMLGAREQDRGGEFNVGHLFSGFKEAPVGQLMLVGVFYLLGMVAIMVGIFSVMGGTMSMFQSPEMMTNPEALPAGDPLMLMLPVLVMMLLLIPLLMAYWFAPALVALDNISALSAMKLSFTGCLKNMLPFLIYGIVMMILSVIASIPLLLGWLILLPVIIATMYTAYSDIYYPEQ